MTSANARNFPGTGVPDLSQVRSDHVVDLGSYSSASAPPAALRNPAARRNLGADNSNPHGHDIAEVTPSEMIAIEAAQLQLNQRYMAKQFGDSDSSLIDEFERVVAETFGALGFIVRVEWVAVEADNMPGRAYLPTITFLARTKDTATDHELIQKEVAAGLHDGQQGYIRADGSRHEDPIKKTIT